MPAPGTGQQTQRDVWKSIVISQKATSGLSKLWLGLAEAQVRTEAALRQLARQCEGVVCDIRELKG
jgi:hypothetical protein